jgi:hypothetical protein
MNNGMYAKCKFTDAQLLSIRQIYQKHFATKMPNNYTGTGVAVFWREGAVFPRLEDKAFDPSGVVKGFVVEEAKNDPLWCAFSDILPFMGMAATITKIPPGMVMNPHIDRPWRPNAIYFPIDGCTKDCVSTYYDDNKKLDSYSVNDNAILTNVHKKHGLVNNSNQTRIAFGWNFKSSDMGFDECYKLLNELGYLC